MHELPPLKALRVFEACIRLGNFTKAAKELNVGQPAISHQISALEKDLGIQLFERRGVLTTPTADAQIYYRSIAGALTDMAKASTAIRRSRRPVGLSLATYPGFAMLWLMPRLSKVQEADPGLVVRVTTAERDEDMPLEDVDCAILFGRGNWPGYGSRLLMTEVVTPVAAPAMAARFAGRSRADLLKDGPLIHLEDQSRRWFNWMDWRDGRSPDTKTINVGLTVTNHGIAIYQCLMGGGVALGWRGVIDELVRNGLLIAMDSEPLSSERGYHLVAKQEFLNKRVGQLLLEALCETTD